MTRKPAFFAVGFVTIATRLWGASEIVLKVSCVPLIICKDRSTMETERKRLLPTESAARKTYPMCTGLLEYFPDALAAVANVSFEGNEKHNPGEPLHHARGKSMDHADCIIRHLLNRGGFDGKIRESAAMAWRALALLQEELEQDLALPLPRGARKA
jgi:hypothetical protein